jgi:hypothetical protein
MKEEEKPVVFLIAALIVAFVGAFILDAGNHAWIGGFLLIIGIIAAIISTVIVLEER